MKYLISFIVLSVLYSPIAKAENIKYLSFYKSSLSLKFHYYTAKARPTYKQVAKILKTLDMPNYIIAVAVVESALRTNVCSGAGACGIWQIMPLIANWCGITNKDRSDVFKSTHCAVKYLKYLKKKYRRWDLAIMGYNGGETRLNKAIKIAGSKEHKDLCFVESQHLRDETCRYLPKVAAVKYFIQGE